MSPALALLHDRAAIRDVMMRYAKGVDTRDFDLVASCFWPEVDGEFAGVRRKNRDELIEFISGVSFFHTTMHFMGPSTIEVEGDRAWLESFAMISHRADRRGGGALRLDHSDALYCEALERRDATWRIRSRGSEPRFAERGVGNATSEDAGVDWLLDRARVDDALAHFALERDRGAKSESSTHLLGHPIVHVANDLAEVAVRALVTQRSGRREASPGDSPFTKRWESERTEPAALRLELERHRERFRVANVSESLEAALPPEAAPPQGDAVSLLERAGVKDRIAREAWALDLEDGCARLLGNQSVDEDQVETYVYRVAAGAHWSDQPERWVEALAGGGPRRVLGSR